MSAHKRLFKFYSDASQLRYITSLITIPKIPPNAPEVFDSSISGLPTRPREPTPEPIVQHEEPEENQDSRIMQWQQHLEQVQNEANMREQNLRYQLEQEKWSEVQTLQQELQHLRAMHSQASQHAQMHEGRVRELESSLANVSLHAVEQESRESYILQLEEQLRAIRTKYEQLAKLYATLRREHLELLSKLKEAKDADKRQVDAMREELEKSRSEQRRVLQQSSEDRAQLQVTMQELSRLENSHRTSVEAVERELMQTKQSLDEMSRAKGAEWQNMVQKWEEERKLGENREKDLRAQVEKLSGELGSMNIRVSSERRAREEDESVLQASVDQALLALAQAQKRESEANARLAQEVKGADDAWRTVVGRMFDGSFTSLQEKVTSAWQGAKSGVVLNVSPAQVQQMMEKCEASLGNWRSHHQKLGHHPSGTQLGDAGPELIQSASAFCDDVCSLVQGIAGVVKEERPVWNGVDDLVDQVVKWCDASKKLVNGVSHQEHVGEKLQALANLVDQAMPRGNVLGDGDVDRQLDLEFSKAAKAIEDAAAKLQQLIPDDVLQGKQVHAAIVEAAGAITASVANLIRSAGLCQQEIVAHERKNGSTTRTFYAKNQRWVEGLVSAARSVAMCTSLLVDSADGIVRGGDVKMEQLVVCANQVTAATVQLVTAARVKALPMSKNQERLEAAAKSVKSAGSLLVGCVEQGRGPDVPSLATAAGDGYGAASYDYKKKEMATQVHILELERALENERVLLAGMRKAAYREAVEGGAFLE
jgi:hypothetical protein